MDQLGATRVFGRHGGVVVIGLRRRPMRDLYHWLVTGSWARLILVFAAVYFATVGLFAGARYLLDLRFPVEGGLADALLSARSLAKAALSALEVFSYWLALAMASGIMLAKFSLVRARILFSSVAVVAPHGGGEALMFRMANERRSHLVDAKVSVMLVRNEVQDGEPVRRAHDLDLLRADSALFSHAWTAIHPLGPGSPLRGESATSLEAAGAEVIVTVSGYDEDLTRTVQARHVYPASRIRWGARFREILKQLPDGRHAVDYRKFHKTVPLEDGAGPGRDRSAARRAR